MSVPTETSRITYAGNGATVAFPTGFVYLDADTVKVTLTDASDVDTVLTAGVDYTLVQAGGEGSRAGTVTMVTAPAVGETLTIERDVSLTQETSFRTQGSFSPAVHEDAMDRIVFEVQELKRDMGDLELAAGSATIAAGSGLTSTGAAPVTLHVGAGPGIIVNADSVEVDFGIGTGGVVSDAVSASNGASNEAARVDHNHIALTDVPGTIAIGDAADQGAAFTLARSDHRHALPAPATPADVTKAAASAGASTTVARADHKHDVSTAAAIELTDSTNAEGAATSLARSNHTHAHGNRGGGTLHAAATNATAGFMSAADKLNMENIGTVANKTKVNAFQAAAQSIPTGLGVGAQLTTYTETLDNDGEFNPATGVYTAKTAGNLLIAAQVVTAAAAWPGGNRVYLGIRKNGSTIGVLTAHFIDPAINRIAVIEAVRFVPVVLGDTIDLFVAHDQGGNVNMNGYLSISRFV